MRDPYPSSEAPTVPTARRGAALNNTALRNPALRNPALKNTPLKDTARFRIPEEAVGRPAAAPRRPAPTLLLLLSLVGGLWWVVGSTALGVGAGTVVLAAGIGLTGLLARALRSRHGSGAALPPGGRRRIVRIVIVTASAAALVWAVLSLLGYGELSVPVVCGFVGLALFPLAQQLDDRLLMTLGAALLVLAAIGALLALDSSGTLYPHGVVGLGAGALFWLTAAHRGGLTAEQRARLRR